MAKAVVYCLGQAAPCRIEKARCPMRPGLPKNAEMGLDLADMKFNRPKAQSKHCGDLFLCEALSQKLQDPSRRR